ncbi:ABC transporter permease [Cryptosporangium minutisporangium]|uniref:Membrane protein n=1 Tax=Cryptosporangium minutisporangium TaxID=113569 RepID=A0ABP6SZX1_9ACTN
MESKSTSTSTKSAAAARHRPAWLEATGLVGALALIVGLLLLAFGLPTVNGGPHDVPLGVVAPPPAVTAVEDALAKAAPGGFDVRTYPDEDALRAAIGDREVYGGFVLGADGGTPSVLVLTASAAGPPIAQGISTIGATLAERNGATATTVDVRALPADDPRGAGLTAMGLPAVLGGVLAAVLLTRRFPRQPWVRVSAAVAFALVEGLVAASVLTWWFGTVDENMVQVALGLAFGLAAVALTVLGLEAVFGIAGIGLGAALFVLLGNPLSGLASGPEFLPSGWGAFGQLLPSGASATLLRANAYFDGAGTATALTVLTCWVVVGLLLVAAGTARARRAGAVSGPTASPAERSGAASESADAQPSATRSTLA